MFGLRQKLALGFGGLLVILLVVSCLGIAVMTQHRREMDAFLSENGRSIEYGQQMLSALSTLDELGPNLRSGRSPEQLAKTAQAAATQIKIFSDNLMRENQNITLNGEQTVASELKLRWDDYLAAYKILLKENTPPVDLETAFATQQRASPQVKVGAQKVIDLNFANLTPLAGHAKTMADSAIRLMILLAIIGVAIALIFTLIVGRSILRPLQIVIRSIREIEMGNLDLVVQVRTRDEIYQLAEAFNSMAAKLREFRRSDQAKLVRTQRTTQLAVDSLPDAIAIINPDGVIELSNLTAQRLFQLVPLQEISQVREHRLRDIFQQVTKELQAWQPRGYASALEVYDQGGQLKFFLPQALPIVDAADNKLLGVTLVLGDITNLRQLDEMKSGLLSVVSHELKTPLTSIRMASHLLLEERIGSLNNKQIELLVAARDDAERLQTIIEDLLDMGRLESGGVKLELHSKDSYQLVMNAVGPLQASFGDRGVQLDVDIQPQTPPVRVDATRIDHVFTNLLTNALKYTLPGGRVRVFTEIEQDVVRFVVEDTGAGIPQEYLPRVFDRFFRVPQANQSSSGAGLGLAIAKEIVTAHHGSIGVRSTHGQGSRFSFTLQRGDVPASTEHTDSLTAN